MNGDTISDNEMLDTVAESLILCFVLMPLGSLESHYRTLAVWSCQALEQQAVGPEDRSLTD